LTLDGLSWIRNNGSENKTKIPSMQEIFIV